MSMSFDPYLVTLTSAYTTSQHSNSDFACAANHVNLSNLGQPRDGRGLRCSTMHSRQKGGTAENTFILLVKGVLPEMGGGGAAKYTKCDLTRNLVDL